MARIWIGMGMGLGVSNRSLAMLESEIGTLTPPSKSDITKAILE